MVKRKSIKPTTKETKSKSSISQSDLVLGYLVDMGKRGATNFEMMMNLHICDVRKRISDLNNMIGLDYSIESEYEESKDGKRYKRYWAVPIDYYGDLGAYLYEGRNTSKVVRKRTGGGRR